jgi:hypothetical protein
MPAPSSTRFTPAAYRRPRRPAKELGTQIIGKPATLGANPVRDVGRGTIARLIEIDPAGERCAARPPWRGLGARGGVLPRALRCVRAGAARGRASRRVSAEPFGEAGPLFRVARGFPGGIAAIRQAIAEQWAWAALSFRTHRAHAGLRAARQA